jgi:hypothetical protein
VQNQDLPFEPSSWSSRLNLFRIEGQASKNVLASLQGHGEVHTQQGLLCKVFFLSVREPYDEMGGRRMLQIIHQKDKRALSKNLQSRKITVHP